MRFADRSDAGRRLGEWLRSRLPPGRYRIFGLARGGVVVGSEVARALGAALEVLAAVKIGAPGEPELAAGAVAEGGGVYWEGETLRHFGVDFEWRERALEEARRELERRRSAYRAGPLEPPDAGETAIIVDDGIATGSTVLAAIDGLRRMGAERVIVAAPVASRESMQQLERVADRVEVLHTPGGFGAVGGYFEAFEPVSDEDVRRCLGGGSEPG